VAAWPKKVGKMPKKSMMRDMETLAQYFDRTKSEKQRSLRRLGHHSLAPTSSRNSAGSTAASTKMMASPERTPATSGRHSLAL
jgi:hypothetical protein